VGCIAELCKLCNLGELTWEFLYTFVLNHTRTQSQHTQMNAHMLNSADYKQRSNAQQKSCVQATSKRVEGRMITSLCTILAWPLTCLCKIDNWLWQKNELVEWRALSSHREKKHLLFSTLFMCWWGYWTLCNVWMKGEFLGCNLLPNSQWGFGETFPTN
jgi:hypothetical protein